MRNQICKILETKYADTRNRAHFKKYARPYLCLAQEI